MSLGAAGVKLAAFFFVSDPTSIEKHFHDGGAGIDALSVEKPIACDVH